MGDGMSSVLCKVFLLLAVVVMATATASDAAQDTTGDRPQKTPARPRAASNKVDSDWWFPPVTDELRYAMVIAIVAFMCLHLGQQWFDSYKRKNVNETDNMLSRMFWGVVPESTKAVANVQKKLLYAKLAALVVVSCAGFWAMWSLCRDSPFSMIAFVVVVLSTLQAGWSAYREDQKKQAEEEAAKKPTGFDRGDRGKLPVTIVTGFLGAGKTTLVNHILHEQQEHKILVIENEVGEQGIDHKLLLDIDTEEVVLLNNGCVCCKVRSDLIAVLKALLEKQQFAHLDGVLIETTGIADPAPVVQTFFMDDALKEKLVLDSVICMVDACNVTRHLDPSGGKDSGNEETIAQIAFADTILVNKLDLIPNEQVKVVAGHLGMINSEARVIFCERAKVSVGELMGLKSFDPDRATAKLQAKDAAICMPVGEGPPKIGAGFARNSGSNHSISTVSIVLPGEFDLTALNRWVASLLKERGSDLYRMKGIVAIHGEKNMFVFHAVHMIFNGREGPAWPEGDTRQSRMVFIGRRLDEQSLRKGFEACCIKDVSQTLEDVE